MAEQQYFMFYTDEGLCYSPSMKNVENLQILGFEYGDDREDALNKLLATNEWIAELKFSVERIKSKMIDCRDVA